MLYRLSGKLLGIAHGFALLEVGGVAFKVAVPEKIASLLSRASGDVSLFTHLHVREDALELYGFLDEEELRFFELLISISGVGPKSALAIMGIESLGKLSAAIQEGRPDLLTRASGIGRKTAERIIVELRGKVQAKESKEIVGQMEGDSDVLEALVALGYRRAEAREALSRLPANLTAVEARLKEVLKTLGKK